MTGSPLPPTSPVPETPTLPTAPKIPMTPRPARIMTPHPARILHSPTPQALPRHTFTPIAQTPDRNRTPTRNFRFRRRLRSSIIESSLSRTPTPTPTPTSSPSTTPTTSPTNSPTPPRHCTPSYTKAQKHITNLRSILSRVHALNLNPRRFTPEIRKSLAGIEWGLYVLLEGGDVYQYLFPKKEGRGKGVWMDADIEGLVRRSGFWVRVWREVKGVVGDFEEAEGWGVEVEVEGEVGKKRKRGEEEEEDAEGKVQCAKKGRG
ncbi:hypothetical protein B9Z19DRAFT_1165162 [Tuber borchii]|uniref:Uncharacterized protein n=1 Tax=Tuber borchii TaxID=42251 RepID=A0A2T7A1K5_TUBBO|nr:hypothetical protein B9Z19DRAFT_1165162 [Tuber borchii]